MKYQCDMIRDLMPLCADSAASEASSRAVREHIGTCTECARIWSEMQQELDLPGDAPAPQEEGYKKAARKYKKKRLAVMLAVFFCGILVTWSVYQLYVCSPYYHGRSTVDGAIGEALSAENGKRLLSERTVSYRLVEQYDAPDGASSIYFVENLSSDTGPVEYIFPVTVTRNQKGLYVGKVNRSHALWIQKNTEKLFHISIDETTSFGASSFGGLPVTELRLTVSGKEQRITKDESDDADDTFYFIFDTPANSADMTGEALDRDGNVLFRLRTAAELGYQQSDAVWIWDFVS